MKPYRLHPQAATEYEEAKAYYTAIYSELGERFEEEMDDLITEVCRHPLQYREYDSPLRRHFSRNFPYAILYLNEPERIWVVAIMHMKRRPSYWKSRLLDR